MGSKRFEGKVIAPILGQPLIIRIVEKMKKCKKADFISVVTTKSLSENPLKKILEKYNVDYFLGTEEDVLNRYFHAAKYYGLESIVRITADNLFISPSLTDLMISKHINKKADFTYLSGVPRGIGLGNGVLSFSCLSKTYDEAVSLRDREHVVTYILDHPEKFKINALKCDKRIAYPNFRLTIDYKEDYLFATEVISRLKDKKKEEDFDLEDVLNLVKSDTVLYNLMLNCIKRSKTL